MHCQISCCEWYQWSAGIYLHSNRNIFSCNMIPRPYCIVDSHSFNTTLLIIAQTYFFQKCSHNCYILTIDYPQNKTTFKKFEIYSICLYLNSFYFRYPRYKGYFGQNWAQTVSIFYGSWEFEDKSHRWESYNKSNNSKDISLPKSRKYFSLQ